LASARPQYFCHFGKCHLHAQVCTFPGLRVAAKVCHAITNDGRKHAVAMTLQTAVARPSGLARDRWDGIDDANYHEHHGEGIAAHHPLAMLLNPAGTNAIEVGGGGDKPAQGLDDRAMNRVGWGRR
jgi:hypothetical protein